MNWQKWYAHYLGMTREPDGNEVESLDSALKRLDTWQSTNDWIGPVCQRAQSIEVRIWNPGLTVAYQGVHQHWPLDQLPSWETLREKLRTPELSIAPPVPPPSSDGIFEIIWSPVGFFKWSIIPATAIQDKDNPTTTGVIVLPEDWVGNPLHCTLAVTHEVAHLVLPNPDETEAFAQRCERFAIERLGIEEPRWQLALQRALLRLNARAV